MDTVYVCGSGTSPLIGGQDPDPKMRLTLIANNTSTDRWFAISLSGGNSNGDAWLWGHGASDPETGISYFAGGANNVQGMLRFNASDLDRVIWTNDTQGSGISGVSADVIAGGMVFLPLRISSILILLGGADVRVPTVSTEITYPSLGFLRDRTSLPHGWRPMTGTYYRWTASGCSISSLVIGSYP